MNEDTSWLKLYRKLATNKLWLSEKFTRGQAWVDLLMLANHHPGQILVRGIYINLFPGQVGWSMHNLADRWMWSNTKVKRFLNQLEKTSQITTQNTNVSLVITIVNWKKYQMETPQNLTQKTTQKRRRNVAETSQKHTILEGVEGVEGKEGVEGEEKKIKVKPSLPPPSAEAYGIGRRFTEHVMETFRGSNINRDKQIQEAEKLIKKYSYARVVTVCKVIVGDDRQGFSFKDTVRTLTKLNENWKTKGRKWFLEIEDYAEEIGISFTPPAVNGRPAMDYKTPEYIMSQYRLKDDETDQTK